MNQRSILFVCVAMIAASLLATCQDLIKLNYLLFPDGWEIEIAAAKKALLEAYAAPIEGSVDGEDGNNHAKTVLRKLNQALKRPNLDPYAQALYQNLVKLANPEELCTPDLSSCGMIVCAILNDPTEEFPNEEFAQFLLKFGKDKFGRHTFQLEQQLVKGPRSYNDVVKEFDEIFGAMFSLKSSTPYGRDKILDKLKLFDFTTTSYDPKPAIEKALGGRTGTDPIPIFYGILLTKCTALRAHRKFQIEVLSLATALGYSFIYPLDLPPKVLRVVEYNRLCSSLHRQREKIETNLRRLSSSKNQGQSSGKRKKSQ